VTKDEIRAYIQSKLPGAVVHIVVSCGYQQVAIEYNGLRVGHRWHWHLWDRKSDDAQQFQLDKLIIGRATA
jgi:hypothetical protein